jgi:hypothetical protein
MGEKRGYGQKYQKAKGKKRGVVNSGEEER